MAAVEPLRVRKAALLLHGLEPAARRQVIARLARVEAARVQPLLAELSQLGIPGSLGDQLDAISIDTSARLPAHERVALMTPLQVAWSLQFCAAATAALLIEARQWPWRRDVLDYMDASRRAAVSWLMCAPPRTLAPAALEALCEQLCTTAAQRPPDEGTNDASAALEHIHGVLRRIIEWMR